MPRLIPRRLSTFHGGTILCPELFTQSSVSQSERPKYIYRTLRTYCPSSFFRPSIFPLAGGLPCFLFLFPLRVCACVCCIIFGNSIPTERAPLGLVTAWNGRMHQRPMDNFRHKWVGMVIPLPKLYNSSADLDMV